MWEFDPSRLVTIPYQHQNDLIALRGTFSCWVFARETYVPSVWMLLKREGFDGDLIRTSSELSSFKTELGLGAIKKLIGFYRRSEVDYWNPLDIWSDFEDLVLRQQLQVYRIDRRNEHRLANINDRFYNSHSSRHFIANDEISRKRFELTERFGGEIRQRWADKIKADRAHFQLTYFDREYAELTEAAGVVGDAAWSTVVGLKDAAVFVCEFAVDAATATVRAVSSSIKNIAAFELRMAGAVLDAMKGDRGKLEAELEAMDLKIRQFASDAATAAKQIASAIANKIKEGKKLFDLLMNDSLSRELLYDYIDSLWQSTSYRESRLTGLKVVSTLVFEIGIDVLIGLATAGAGVLAKRAAQLASKAGKAAKLRFGPFAAEAMDMLADLARLMDKKLNVSSPKSQSALNVPDEAKKSPKPKSAADNSHAKADVDSDQPATNQNGEVCSKNSLTCKDGEPISMVTGEEILELTDFVINGALSLPWVRSYKSSNATDVGMGVGWTHPFAEKLISTPFGYAYHTSEARIIPFPKLSLGQSSTHKTEKLKLIRHGADTFSVMPSDGRGLVKRFELKANDSFLLTSVRDGLGNGVDLVYNKECQLKEIVTDYGARWCLQYDNRHLIHVNWHSITGDIKSLVTYQYDGNNDLIVATDALGNSEQYRFDNHIIRQRTLKSGYNFYFEWTEHTPRARCLRNWGDPIEGLPTYDYKFNWHPESKSVDVTDTRGGVKHYQFNDLGLPLLIIEPEGGETRYSYDAFGNTTKITNPLGQIQTYSYDRNQQLIKITQFDGAIVEYKRDGRGNVIATNDVLGEAWWRSYNEQGLVKSQTDPLGATYHYQYNAQGLPRSVTNPLGQSWHYIWDNLGQLTAVRNPQGQHTRYKRNGLGLVEAIILPDGTRTKYHYNDSGLCTCVEAASGAQQHYRYNGLGLLTSHTTHDGRTTNYEYNGLSQVVQRTDSLGQTLRYQYDGERNLVGLTNENGNQYRLKYDLNERLIEEIGFDGRTQRYQYNALGHLTSSEEIHPNSGRCDSRLRYRRDAQGRLLEQWLDVQSGEPVQILLKQFAYDRAGRLTHANNTWRKLAWQYDAIGRVTEAHQDVHIIRHQYDALGRRIGSELPRGEKLNYQFNATGGIAAVELNGQLLAGFSHDELGREIKRVHGNQLVNQQTYDPQGRLQKQSLVKANVAGAPGIVNERQYGYNAAGQLSEIADQRRGTTHYVYDSIDRLLAVQGPNPETFVHDPAGNLLSNNGTVEQPGQLSNNRLNFHGDCHYEYDNRGNRITERRGKGGKLVTQYRYDGLNQLAEVESDNQTVTYRYDALGRRIAKSVTTQNETRKTEFLWNDDVLLSEQSNNGDSKTYIFEPASFRPLAFVENEQIYHYHLDHLGTPQEISNGDGDLVWSANYRAYGSLALADIEQVENNLRFQGQYFDGETGLHYNRFRYYDPEVGRFTQQDPIGLLGGINNYQYALNPVTWNDPFGLSCKEERIANARARQAQMLTDNVGYNVSPVAWDSYPSIGRAGSFVSDKQGITDIIGDIDGQSTLVLDKSKILELEKSFGLEPGSLQGGFKIRKVENISAKSPRSPMEGNRYFMGAGNHLPGGAPEMVIDSISTVDGGDVSTILQVTPK